MAAASGGAGRAGSPSAGWAAGLAFFAVEVVAVAYLCLVFGGLSAMLADTCFRGSTELICEPRWQGIMAATAMSALVVTVVVAAVLMWWRRQRWTLGVSMVAVPVVPLAAFLVMQEVVTA